MRPARRRLLLGTVAAAAGGLGLWLARPESAVKNGPTILADNDGGLRTVISSLNSARRSSLPNALLVQNLVNALPADTQVLVLTNDRDAFRAVHDNAAARVRFVELPADDDFTIWPQDPFVVLREADGSNSLLQPAAFERAGDRHMARALGEALGWPVRRSALHFEGGNLLADQDYVYVGADTVRINALHHQIDDMQAAWRLEQELGRRVMVIGSVPQPVPHIDMILTPLGDRRLMLADTAAGARLAQRELSLRPDSVREFEQRTEQSVFGSPLVSERRLADGTVLRPPPLAGTTARAAEQSLALAGYFDALAEALAARGFRIERAPMLMMPELSATAPPAARERPFAVSLPYPMLSYNNALVTRPRAQAHVYLPQYGWPAMDSAGRDAWERIGFDVTPVPGFAPGALLGGALRCTLKVLERDRWPPPQSAGDL